MKLYKCVDEDSGREFLRSGRITVDRCEDQTGVILFSPEKLLQVMPADSLMLEFEVTDCSLLVPSVRPRECVRMLSVRLSGCEHVDAGYRFKLESDFKLETIYIGPDCQIGWEHARLHLRKMGMAQTIIKILAREILAGENRTVMVINEWFVAGENGLRRFARNPNCPNVYYEAIVPDVADVK